MCSPSGSKGREPILKVSSKARGGRGQVKVTGQTSPEVALFLRRAGANRYGVRAFSTLEGYAGRDRETELALTAKKRENARPPSRFSSEMERRQTRSSNERASVRVRNCERL
jgi:hypothetical protein